MPLYTVMTQDGFLSAEQRDDIAAGIVAIHTAAMNVPAHFVHSIFPTYPRNHAYGAANHSPVASILGVIRAGHTSEEKMRLVQALWKMFQDNTGVSGPRRARSSGAAGKARLHSGGRWTCCA